MLLDSCLTITGNINILYTVCVCVWSIDCPTGRSEDLKLYPRTFFFYQYIRTLSSRAVYGHQMYLGGSVVCKASTVGIEITPTLS